MINVTVSSKKNRKGKKEEYLRFNGSLLGKHHDLWRRFDNGAKIAKALEVLIAELAPYAAIGALYPEKLMSQLAAIKEPKFLTVLDTLGLIPDEIVARDFGVGAFLSECLARDAVKVKDGLLESSTLTKRKNAVKKFILHFGQSFDIRKLDYASVSKYRDKRLSEHSRSLVSGEIKILRMYFREAVKAGSVRLNPIEDIKVEIDHAAIEKKRIIIDAVDLDTVEAWLKENRPNDYYVYFVLLRYCGCRKNEPLHLKWSDVDFEALDGVGIIDLPSPKTRKKNKASRRMPMFVGTPLREVLLAEFQRQQGGGNPAPAGYVCRGVCSLSDLSRDTVNWDTVNPGTNLKRLIVKAGVKPWVKTCQNIRVTRENELLISREYRPEAVHYWIGHTRKTFESSYAQLAESDWKPAKAFADN